jgi:hypothetical protein
VLRDTDSELEDDDQPKAQKKKKKSAKKEGASWLKEGGDEEDIIDFLDPSVAKKVLATKPSKESDKEKISSIKHNFKMAPDGRFIITDAPSDDEGKGWSPPPS